ncbi:peptidase zinc-dependent [Thermovibrio ammonificans]|jgi:archaemetzincin|uniref:Peptidase zinc-dependent n=1 Tax=Thermovibrio ammonificans (strain DSM 15698 / JCM 12110 / HB-1) TaxID=648996 RepID=E8T610_THEA1|nr:peptidase zinc-dependent [Thermovibrio ammonificans]ADU96594.1 peptidase zinc-dependent [Thermovibrio ammonificans HB-1]
MALASLYTVGVALPFVEEEAEKVLKEKFNLSPRFEGALPPDSTGARGSQLLAEVQLQHALALKPSDSLFVVVLTPYDLYSNGLNFVFGVAYPFKGCIVSYARLISEDDSLFLSRFRKELTHEMGHVFGLPHCPNPSCVMHFSNSLADTDAKSENFCQLCSEKLRRVMVELGLI